MADSSDPDGVLSTCEEVLAHLRTAFAHHGYTHRLTLALEVPVEAGCPCHTAQVVDGLPGPQEREVAALDLAERGLLSWETFAGWTLSRGERLKMVTDLAGRDTFAHWPGLDRQRHRLLDDLRACDPAWVPTGTRAGNVRAFVRAALWALCDATSAEADAELGKRPDEKAMLRVLLNLPAGLGPAAVRDSVDAAFCAAPQGEAGSAGSA